MVSSHWMLFRLQKKWIYLKDFVNALLDSSTSNSEYLHHFDHPFQNAFQVFSIQSCELSSPVKGN